MYKQERKAGFPQFLLCLVAAVFVWIICDIVGLLIKNALISDVLFVVAACIFVYCVYVHYCASFSYEFTKNKLVITRKIGHKEHKEEISLSKINTLCEKKPNKYPKDVKNFTASIFSKKNRCYIIYHKGAKCLIIEPDDKLLQLLKENIND